MAALPGRGDTAVHVKDRLLGPEHGPLGDERLYQRVRALGASLRGALLTLTGARVASAAAPEFDVSGAAARSRFAEYGINPDGVTRTAQEAVELARARGVVIPDDIHIQFPEKWTRADADAEYVDVGKRYRNATDKMTWDDFYHDQTGLIPVRLNPAIARSDEALIANIAHEMYELNQLRAKFEAAPNGKISIGQVARMINRNDHPIFPGARNNLQE